MLYTSIVAERIGLRRSFAVIMAMSFALNFILAHALLLQQATQHLPHQRATHLVVGILVQ